MDSFGLPLSVMKTPCDLEEAVFDQLVECARRGSLHTELRGSPFTYRESVDAPLEEIAAAVVRGVDRAWAERRVSGTFVLAFSRQKGIAASTAPPDRRQARVVALLSARLHRPDRPVGLDMAGFPEIAFPPRLFVEALAPAREAGVPLTIHAGEQGVPPGYGEAPPDLIVEAIETLGAARIGHGTSLAASSRARSIVRERQVGVECCPWSNDMMGFTPAECHPLPDFLAEGILASLGTDDPLMFDTATVSEVFAKIAGALDLGATALTQLTRNAIETAFVTKERREWLRARLRDALK